MIKVEHLSFSYSKNPFIQDMNFSVSEGEIFVYPFFLLFGWEKL